MCEIFQAAALLFYYSLYLIVFYIYLRLLSVVNTNISGSIGPILHYHSSNILKYRCYHHLPFLLLVQWSTIHINLLRVTACQLKVYQLKVCQLTVFRSLITHQVTHMHSFSLNSLFALDRSRIYTHTPMLYSYALTDTRTNSCLVHTHSDFYTHLFA